MADLVTILIVNYNCGEHLTATLRGLQAQTFREFRVVVIDNASTDASFLEARTALAADARFTFVLAGSNLGFAAANNMVAGRVETPWLALLNPDAAPMPQWLEALLSATRRHPDVAMFGSQQLQAAAPHRLDGAGDCYFAAGLPWRGGYGWPADRAPSEGPVFSPCAAAALYSSAAFNEAGGFDERFFCYVEDIDLGFRLRLAGHRAIQVTEAIVHHVGGASSGGVSDFARYHGIRNSIWCFVQNMPGVLFWGLLLPHVMLWLAYGAMAAVRGHSTPFRRAVADAMIGMPLTWRRRAEVQAARRASLKQIAAALCWNPVSLMRCEPVRLHEPSRGRI